MFEHKVKSGDTVIRQGDDGDYFYVIEEGVYHALINVEDGSMKKVFEYNHEGNFGELALLYNMPRAATIQVISAHLSHLYFFLFPGTDERLPLGHGPANL